MIKKILVNFILSCCLFIPVFSGCTPVTPKNETIYENATSIPEKEQTFRHLVPIEDMNISIKLSIPIEWNNDLRLGKAISMEVENTSDNNFKYPFIEGPKVYAYIDENWIEIENSANYVGTFENIVKAHSFLIAGVAPNPPQLDKEIELRIVLTGHLVDENGNELKRAGAYIDINLGP